MAMNNNPSTAEEYVGGHTDEEEGGGMDDSRSSLPRLPQLIPLIPFVVHLPGCEASEQEFIDHVEKSLYTVEKLEKEFEAQEKKGKKKQNKAKTFKMASNPMVLEYLNKQRDMVMKDRPKFYALLDCTCDQIRLEGGQQGTNASKLLGDIAKAPPKKTPLSSLSSKTTSFAQRSSTRKGRPSKKNKKSEKVAVASSSSPVVEDVPAPATENVAVAPSSVVKDVPALKELDIVAGAIVEDVKKVSIALSSLRNMSLENEELDYENDEATESIEDI